MNNLRRESIIKSLLACGGEVDHAMAVILADSIISMEDRKAAPDEPSERIIAKKKCRDCRTSKLLSDFYRDRRHKSGRVAVCKLCWKERYREQ